MKLKGRNALITGANQGLGREIAIEFIKNGASVAICARDENKLLQVERELKAIAQKNQRIIAVKADISDENDVKKFIDKGIEVFEKIHIFVNNAGVYGPKGPIETIDSSQWLKAIGINLNGVFFCCKHIISHMKNNRYGKIINLSGGGATSPLPFISSYAASKAAVVRLTETIALECKDFNIDVNAVAPGALNTRFLDEVLEAGPDMVGQSFYEKAVKQKQSGGVPLDLGASLCVYLASTQSDRITGRLISAKWDPWQDLAKHCDELSESDIYTLRRIIPEERGKEWV